MRGLAQATLLNLRNAELPHAKFVRASRIGAKHQGAWINNYQLFSWKDIVNYSSTQSIICRTSLINRCVAMTFERLGDS